MKKMFRRLIESALKALKATEDVVECKCGTIVSASINKCRRCRRAEVHYTE